MNLHSTSVGGADKKQAYKLCKLEGARPGVGRGSEQAQQKGYGSNKVTFEEREERWLRWTLKEEHPWEQKMNASGWHENMVQAIEPQEEESQMDQSKNQGVAGAGLREEARDPSRRALWGWLRKGFILNEVDTSGSFEWNAV